MEKLEYFRVVWSKTMLTIKFFAALVLCFALFFPLVPACKNVTVVK